MHRKNSLFYKTQNGARVGDLFMSLIHTAELSGADPFRYSRRCSPTPPRDGRQPLPLDALELSRRTGHQRAGDRPARVARLLSFHAPPPCHPGPRHATGRRRPGQSQRNPGNRRAYAPVPKGHDLRLHARPTSCARAQIWTLRQRLLTIGAQVVSSTRRLLLRLPESFPYKPEWIEIACGLGACTG